VEDLEAILKNVKSGERVGRQLTNSFGVKETVVMPIEYWKYLDWLEERGLDVDDMMAKIDINRHKPKFKLSLANALMSTLTRSESRRKEEGLTVPGYIVPKVSKRHVPQLTPGLPDQIKEEALIAGSLTNAFGVKETALMSQAHWEYYYWCIEQNCKMADWVKSADEMRPKDKTFGENLMYWLWDDLCARYREGVETPNGPPPLGYESDDA